MKKLYFLILLTCLFIFQAGAQSNRVIPPPPCYANGNSGFGGAVGLNSFFLTDDGTTLNFLVSTYEGDMNDVFVLYFSTGAPGRSVIDSTVDDDADAYRIAITNSNAYGFGSTITFSSGFEATHMVAIDTNFGGLWSIPSLGNVGTGELNFIKSVNSTLASSTQTPYEFSFDWADIGLTNVDGFGFVGLYVSHTGYSSDEGYGEGITVGTQGADDITYTNWKNYQNGSVTLGSIDNNVKHFEAQFINGTLKINGYNDTVKIKVYDLFGRLLQESNYQINGSFSLPMKLAKKQLQFIVIESKSARKILKVIPQ